MDILITGASGRLGKYVVPMILEKYKKHNIITFSRSPTTFSGTYEILGDLKNIINYKKELGDIDKIFWLASKINYEDSYAELYSVNVKPVEVALTMYPNADIIYVSSTAVYGFGDNMTEQTPLAPSTLYGQTKAEAEMIIKRFRRYQILRPALIIGRLFTIGFEDVYTLLKKEKFFFVGNTDSKIPVIHALDVARAIMFCDNMIDNHGNRIYNVVNENSPTQKELVNFVCAQKNIRPPKHTLPIWLAKLLIDKKYHYLIEQIGKQRGISAANIIKDGFKFEKNWQEGVLEIIAELEEKNLTAF